MIFTAKKEWGEEKKIFGSPFEYKVFGKSFLTIEITAIFFKDQFQFPRVRSA